MGLLLNGGVNKSEVFSLLRSLAARFVIKPLRSLSQLSESGGVKHYLHYK